MQLRLQFARFVINLQRGEYGCRGHDGNGRSPDDNNNTTDITRMEILTNEAKGGYKYDSLIGFMFYERNL
jgi:hypothetical protein